jgi:gluconate 2-dehydrogenase gamma chain
VPPSPGRRVFFRQAATGAAALLCAGDGQAATRDPPAQPVEPLGHTVPDGVYLCFNPEEADFVEALVDHMCPPDDLTPGGTDCGLAVFMDRQLAGAFGQGDRLYLRGPFRPGLAEDGYQMPLTPMQQFKAGVRAFDEACGQKQRAGFARLDPPAKEAALIEVAAGRWDEGRVGLGAWFNDLVYPLFLQACFADPIYGGNRDKVFWKMIGYPGLPAVNGLNMVKYRGKPFPGARHPKSIQDFS